MNIVDHFLRHASAHPHRTALVIGKQRFSYAQLQRHTERVCAQWLAMDIRQGDCIVLALDNCAEFTLCMLAAAELGVMLAPISTSLPADAVMRSMQATAACYLIANPSVCRRFIEAAPADAKNAVLVVGSALAGCRYLDITAQQPASYRLGSGQAAADSDFLLTMTSGSTGDPKPITLTQACKIRRALDGAQALYGLGDAEVVITSTPMYHSLGFRLALLPLLIGGTSVILPHFSPRGWIAAVQQQRVTFAIMVSSHLEQIEAQLAREPQSLDSLHTIVSSSALLRPELKQRCIERFACDFHECYGASEVGIVTNLAPADGQTNLHSVGKALDYVELAIVDDQGRPVAVSTVGEIICRTTTRFSGYFGQPEATMASVRDGFFFTGDLGYLDDDGYLYLAGRKKDMIIVGGTNVYPEDVEAVLMSAPGVRECAVIGVADSYFGEAVLAVVIADPEAELDKRRLRAFCAQSLADFQQPQAYEVVSSLPRTALGKVQRQMLRDRYADYDATADLRRLLQRRAQ